MCVTRINKNEIETFVYRKDTNTNIYINRYSQLKSNCKTETLRNPLKRAKLRSPTKILLRKEINYIPKVS